jgi:hypothetical protein
MTVTAFANRTPGTMVIFPIFMALAWALLYKLTTDKNSQGVMGRGMLMMLAWVGFAVGAGFGGGVGVVGWVAAVLLLILAFGALCACGIAAPPSRAEVAPAINSHKLRCGARRELPTWELGQALRMAGKSASPQNLKMAQAELAKLSASEIDELRSQIREYESRAEYESRIQHTASPESRQPSLAWSFVNWLLTLGPESDLCSSYHTPQPAPNSSRSQFDPKQWTPPGTPRPEPSCLDPLLVLEAMKCSRESRAGARFTIISRGRKLGMLTPAETFMTQ